MDRDTNIGRQGFAEALGRTIKVARTDLGIDRKELAERVGISYSYLSAIENGDKQPSSSVLATIAESLGARLHQLLERVEVRRDCNASAGSSHWLTLTGASNLGAGLSGPPSPQPTSMLPIAAEQGAARARRASFMEEMERLSGTLTASNRRLLLDMARNLAK